MWRGPVAVIGGSKGPSRIPRSNPLRQPFQYEASCVGSFPSRRSAVSHGPVGEVWPLHGSHSPWHPVYWRAGSVRTRSMDAACSRPARVSFSPGAHVGAYLGGSKFPTPHGGLLFTTASGLEAQQFIPRLLPRRRNTQLWHLWPHLARGSL